MSRNALIVVAKQPAPGQTKTRLAPPLTSERAAELYKAFLLDTLDLVRAAECAQPFIAYLPEAARGYFGALAPDFELLTQRGANLGERLDSALTECLTGGYDRAVIMDSDSPTLPAEYLKQAFEAMAEADGVLGPCDDGGYYLIGLRRPAPRLLREVPMSTPTVVSDTLALAAGEGLQMAQLPAWYDVDTVTDLERLRADLAALPSARAAHTRTVLEAA
jgi:rSAM/selenodomain-associated transferase 1